MKVRSVSTITRSPSASNEIPNAWSCFRGVILAAPPVTVRWLRTLVPRAAAGRGFPDPPAQFVGCSPATLEEVTCLVFYTGVAVVGNRPDGRCRIADTT